MQLKRDKKKEIKIVVKVGDFNLFIYTCHSESCSKVRVQVQHIKVHLREIHSIVGIEISHLTTFCFTGPYYRRADPENALRSEIFFAGNLDFSQILCSSSNTLQIPAALPLA